MSTGTITVQAVLQPDGVTLSLEERLRLPPGHVTVTVRPTGVPSGPTMLEVLDRIHRDRERRGCRQLTEEELAAEISQLRGMEDDYEEQWREIWSQSDAKSEATGNT